MKITVIGCGPLGATTAACMAELGYDVLGVEIDPSKLDLLRAGKVPFYEPGLADMLATHVGTGRLRFTDSMAEAAAFADLHFVGVGTPQRTDGLGADLSQVEGAIEGLAHHLTGPALVIGKSTVPVGTAARMNARLREIAGDQVELAWNPEFLREGFAVKDTLEPDRLVFGVVSDGAEQRLRDVFAPIIDRGTAVVVTDFPTAELVKVAANAFLATKISYINAVAEVCEAAGADIVDLADALGHDVRIGRGMLNAGIGYGGGCLPKDVRAFVHRAGELGVEDIMGLLGEVDDINQRQRERVVAIAIRMLGGSVAGKRIGVWGAAFKPETDDVRDSPALHIAGQLHLRGALVTVFDPKAHDTALAAFPTMRYADSAVEACRDADLVMHMTAWPEFASITVDEVAAVTSGRLLLDGRNVLDLDAWRAAGWTARGLGRR